MSTSLSAAPTLCSKWHLLEEQEEDLEEEQEVEVELPSIRGCWSWSLVTSVWGRTTPISSATSWTRCTGTTTSTMMVLGWPHTLSSPSRDVWQTIWPPTGSHTNNTTSRSALTSLSLTSAALSSQYCRQFGPISELMGEGGGRLRAGLQYNTDPDSQVRVNQIQKISLVNAYLQVPYQFGDLKQKTSLKVLIVYPRPGVLYLGGRHWGWETKRERNSDQRWEWLATVPGLLTTSLALVTSHFER